jgi:hypothetical protein
MSRAMSSGPRPCPRRATVTGWRAAATALACLSALGPSAGAQGDTPDLARGSVRADSAWLDLGIAAGYVAPKVALEDDGRVIASATEGDIPERSLTLFDVIHVDPVVEGRSLAPGDTLLVYRDAGDLQNPVDGKTLGRIVYPSGLAVVTDAQAEVASARIVAAFDAVQVGQAVQHLKAAASPIPMGERAAGEGVVVGVRDAVAVLEPLGVIFLDLPAGSVPAVGQKVELVRPVRLDGRELPDLRIGYARVVDVGESAATAVVIQLDRSDLRLRDHYRPAEPGS